MVSNTSYGKNELTVPTILAAIKGDTEAIYAVINHYRGYITSMATQRFRDEYGKVFLAVDEELRQELEAKLITKILTFRPRAA